MVSCCTAQHSVDESSSSAPSASHRRLPISSSAAILGQVLSLVKPTLLPVPACGHSPQEYHLPRKVSSHFPLLACLVASVPGATLLQLSEPVATTVLPLCPTSAVIAFFGPVPSFTGTVMVLGAGSCCFTVPRSAWSLRCSSACFCEASLAASRALRPTVAEFGTGVASASPGHRPTRARGSFCVLLGLPLPWCVLFHVHGHPGPSHCRGTSINFIHIPGYTAFKEAYQQLSSNALLIAASPQCLTGEPSCEVDLRA